MRVGVVGVGYVGLSTAVCLATKFHTVAVDKNQTRIRDLKKGVVPIHEKGLEALLKKAATANRLSFSDDPAALSGADAVFITVGTPSQSDGSIDLSQVKGVCYDLGNLLRQASDRPLILVKSTVVPGTSREVVKPVLERASGKKCGEGFLLCSNPEFLREGSAIQDSLKPQRIVLGPFDEASLAAARALYRKFYGQSMPPLVQTTPEGAELVKYASNSFLASKVSFVNLLARICELYPGTDVSDVARGMGLDPRIGGLFLQAGPGFGGSCFPKDVKAFSTYLRGLAIDTSILDGVLEINDFQPRHVVALAEKHAGTLSGKEVAVLGLAFKAETDDVRSSRSIPVVLELLEKGANVRVYDPMAMETAKAELGSKVTYSSSARECVRGADVAITMTAWKEFKTLKPSDFERLMRSPLLIDARRIYDPAAYSQKLAYYAVGRGVDGAA